MAIIQEGTVLAGIRERIGNLAFTAFKDILSDEVFKSVCCGRFTNQDMSGKSI
ncbi:hypothetical protein HDE69_000383 [Pedobacter cryoconitis]|uniref:Uncharacterized protein n=1 Tax=Pedobacter cryoconitis TaxID=188932 RepID=A0A7W8YPA6_9SPHI|nr:hypothetical protein [Pedobacter cryoconitis]MBB5619347.1 hypothetical protein [Pedobacter cryoconitis]